MAGRGVYLKNFDVGQLLGPDYVVCKVVLTQGFVIICGWTIPSMRLTSFPTMIFLVDWDTFESSLARLSPKDCV